MRLKMMAVGTALAVATTGAAIALTAAPAAAVTTINIPGIDRNELRWRCAESGGDWIELPLYYFCYLPDGTLVSCEEGGDCRVVVAAEPSPGRTPPVVVPRPTASPPSQVAP